MTLSKEQIQQLKQNKVKGELWEWTKERNFYAYPKWIQPEKDKRAKYPDPRYYVTSITVKFMTPSGNEEFYRHYMPWKGPLSMEIFPWVIRHLEDRFMLFLEKTWFFDRAVEEELKEVDLASIRQFLKRKKEKDASSSESE